MAPSELDLDRLRAETPGVAFGIHLNNAGAALAPEPVIEAVLEHLRAEVRLGGYEAAEAREGEIEEAYRAVEGLLGAPRGSVAFVENATSAFAQALSAVAFRAGDLILTTRHDYVSNQLMYLSLRKRFGVRVERVPDAPGGGADVQAMVEAVAHKRPRLVAMTHMPTYSGLVQDPVPVAAECRRFEIPFLLDACQSVGQMPVDVREIPATFIAATSRKFLRGPRGAGFLYVDPAALAAGAAPLFPDLRGAEWVGADRVRPAPDARRFENWEFAWALVLGTGAAARYATQVGLEAIRERAWGLAERLREGLGGLPGVRVLDRGPRLSAIVTCTVAGREPALLVEKLREHGIRTSWVGRSSALLDFEERGVEGALRLSPHYYTADAEAEAAVGVLAELVE